MQKPTYPVFDADNHLYESPDFITDYLPKEHRRDIQIIQVKGYNRLLVKGQLVEYMPDPTFEYLAAPGVHVDYYKGNNPEGKTLREFTGEPIHCQPEFRDPVAKIKSLDEHGVDQTLMFPTLANLLEHSLIGDPDLTHTAIHAVNEYFHDTWSFNYQNRIYGVPVITMCLVEKAIAELEWVLERGAKAILIRPGPAAGYHGPRSNALEEYDPFWARVQESGIAVCFHAALPPLADYHITWEPGSRSQSAFQPTPLKQLILAHRDIEDQLAAMICHGALTRFPKLRIASVENGSDWVGHLLKGLEKNYRQLPQFFKEHPLDVFRRNIYINPFWEEDINELIGHVGEDRVIFGSDWPHPEGLAEPLSYLEFLNESQVSQQVQKKIMYDNSINLLNLKAA